MNKKIILAVAVLLFAAVGAFAQTSSDNHTVTITIAAIAAIDLNNTTDVAFSTVPPVLAGDDIGPTAALPATDTSKRLWYTALNATGNTRRITVGSSSNPPAGTTLQVMAAPEALAGTGSTRAISTVAADLVTAIPSVTTGRTGTDGAALTYSFWVSAPGSLAEQAATSITVTYTLTDDA
jgi:hypothetical protein